MFAKEIRKGSVAFTMSIILVWIASLSARPCSNVPPGTPGPEMCCITFTEKASGGTLIMWDNLGRNARYVVVETIENEPAEIAIERLAEKIDETDPFDWLGFPTGKKRVTAAGGELKGILGVCGEYMFAGTETGLGIPRPPHSLTCNYDPNLEKLSLRWANPPNGYDSIRVRINWSNYDHTGGAPVQGDEESYVRDLKEKPVDMDDVDILVIGVRNDIPSGAAAIHVNNNVQEELYGIPFTGGIAPNWQAWSLDSNENEIGLEMGIRNELTFAKGRYYNSIKTPETKPFYQVIKTGTKGGTGGVFRKFIGLTPGHTYRVKARVATLSEPNEKNWSVSVHAAAGNGQDLTQRQMAGLDTLPIPEAAIRMVGTANPTGQFAEISTGRTVDGQEIKDITLPASVDSITVWVKCTSSADLSAAIDWISLEDLSFQKS